MATIEIIIAAILKPSADIMVSSPLSGGFGGFFFGFFFLC